LLGGKDASRRPELAVINHLVLRNLLHRKRKRGVDSMTFRKWYEEVKGRSFAEVTPREKNSLESEFLDYLKRHVQGDSAAAFYQQLAGPHSPSVA